jgi:hypothetical protein
MAAREARHHVENGREFVWSIVGAEALTYRLIFCHLAYMAKRMRHEVVE